MNKLPVERILECSDEENSLISQVLPQGLNADTDEIDSVFSLCEGLIPKDRIKSGRDTIRKFEQGVVARLMNQFIVGCLATDFKNRLMWSHYADSHKGFCVEYDFSQVNPDLTDNLPLPIIYSTQRPQIPWEAVFEHTPESMKKATNHIVEALLTKDEAWVYENEWRILIQGDSGKPLPMPPITCIYLGYNMNKVNRGKIIKLAKSKGIPVKQMKVDRGKFELHAEEIK